MGAKRDSLLTKMRTLANSIKKWRVISKMNWTKPNWIWITLMKACWTLIKMIMPQLKAKIINNILLKTAITCLKMITRNNLHIAVSVKAIIKGSEWATYLFFLATMSHTLPWPTFSRVALMASTAQPKSMTKAWYHPKIKGGCLFPLGKIFRILTAKN